MLKPSSKAIVYAQDSFNKDIAKTGLGFIRYGLCETVGVVDKSLALKTTNDVVKDLPKIPIFDSVESAKKARSDADVLLIGIATSGGRFPKDWLGDIKKAIKLKLNIVNGLHDFLSDIDEIKNLALKERTFIWDVRKTTRKFEIANARLLDYPIEVILTVGTDGAIGKMTVALELTKFCRLKQIRAKFIATGQTGMMISGEGVPVDAISGDFMAGAVEEEIIKAAKENFKIAFVEGQGSILHPGWSGVTLALLHGALPHKLILCHKIGREYIKSTKVKIESLKQFVRIYEEMSCPLRKAKVVGIGLNTLGLSEKETQAAIKQAEDETGLIADDPLKYTGEKLLNVCMSAHVSA